MIPLAERWEAGVRDAIDECGLQWSVTRLGCRAEYWPDRLSARGRSGGDGRRRGHHLSPSPRLNRNVLLTPFHNMALMCPTRR